MEAGKRHKKSISTQLELRSKIKRYNIKLKSSQHYREINSLFRLNKDDFRRELKVLEKRNSSVNFNLEKLKESYEKIFNENNLVQDEAERKVDLFLKKYGKTRKNEKYEKTIQH